MPTHYGGSGKKSSHNKKSTHNKKDFKGMKKMTKEQHDRFLKAEKDGLISRKQHNSLPPQLLEAIIKSKMKKK